MLYKEFDIGSVRQITFTRISIWWLLPVVVCIFTGNLGYVVRIRTLSWKCLNRIKSIRMIFLRKFISSAAPSAAGGTSPAIFFVNKEGIKAGRTPAIVMATYFPDELYFILMFPFIILRAGHSNLWNIHGANEGISKGLIWLAVERKV